MSIMVKLLKSRTGIHVCRKCGGLLIEEEHWKLYAHTKRGTEYASNTWRFCLHHKPRLQAAMKEVIK